MPAASRFRWLALGIIFARRARGGSIQQARGGKIHGGGIAARGDTGLAESGAHHQFRSRVRLVCGFRKSLERPSAHHIFRGRDCHAVVAAGDRPRRRTPGRMWAGADFGRRAGKSFPIAFCGTASPISLTFISAAITGTPSTGGFRDRAGRRAGGAGTLPRLAHPSREPA